MRRTLLSLILISLFLPTVAGEKSELWYMHFDQVKPDQIETFEKASAGWVEAFKKADMGPDFNFFVSSSPEFTYVTSWSLKSYAQLDNSEKMQAMVAEKVGQETLDALEKMAAPTIARHHSSLSRHLSQLSYHPANPMTAKPYPPFMSIGVHYVKPGKGDDFKNVITRLKEALTKADHGLGFDIFRVEFGMGSYVMIWHADDAAQFFANNKLKGVLEKALGQESARQLYADWRSTIHQYDYHLGSFREELSYISQPAETEKKDK